MNDWGAGSSPRKEYGSAMRGGANNSDNWRRHRADDVDADGWRTSHRGGGGGGGQQDKWGATGGRGMTSNWRDGDTRDEHGHLSDRQASNRVSWHSSGDSSKGAPHRKPWDVEDHLPEWAMENPSESGGTFDASGAFHGSDEETPTEKGGTPNKTSKDGGNALQKSASQQNITPSKKPAPLSTSQSATNLIKKSDEPPNAPASVMKDSVKEKREEKAPAVHEHKHVEGKQKTERNEHKSNNTTQSAGKKLEKHESTDSSSNNMGKKNMQVNSNGLNKHEPITHNNKVDDEFDHMKEVTDDIVAKLMLDDEVPKQTQPTASEPQRSTVGSTGVTQLPYTAGLAGVLGSTATPTIPPPPGTAQDKWYYRDPQGEVQGPFTAQEMAEWFRAGYFTVSLLVRRQCDERYFTLGDLVKQCPGIPFLNCRLQPLKNDPVSMGISKVIPNLADPVLLQQIHMQRLLQRHAEAVRTLSQTEPWGALSNLQQRELVTQHMMSQPQVLSDLPFIPQIPQNTQMSNPLMHMISQMQQANKIPTQASVVDNPPNSQHLDPLQQLVQQMGGMQPNMVPNLHSPQPQTSSSTANNVMDPNQSQQEDPIKSLLRQLANQPQRDIWDMRGGQAPYANQQPQQWLGGAPNVGGTPTNNLPHSMWDLHPHTTTPVLPPHIVTPTSAGMSQSQQPTHQGTGPVQNQATPIIPDNVITEQQKEQQEKEEQKKKTELEKEQKQKERKEAVEREKRKKEQEQLDKVKAQKEAEEKRKEEQRKREAEKRAEAEKQKKEEERIRKELEKAKREAEEKRLRELEEKKRLKEQRKTEEEAKKKAEEERKKEEEERQSRKEAEKKEEQARRQAEALRKMQEQQQQQRTKVAPWCQAASAVTTPSGLSMAEIQRAEREKRAEQAALVQQQKVLAAAKELQEQQTAQEKSTIQLKWASKKPAAPKKIKSLAEIQAEEQERITKQAAEARLAQQQKEKESATVPAPNPHTSIWSSASQSLTWATNTHNAGFWDDTPIVQKSPAKPTSGIVKSHSTSVMNNSNSVQHQLNNKAALKPNKLKAKKEEQQVMKLFDKNGPSQDEFTAWCTKTLATLNSDVDIPTFIGFLRDIESPYEVKDYVRQYLGDSPNALHFANQFVERRSRVKDQQRAAMQHKDDLCQPAPAITPSSEFQEVKGKGKKIKKSKMMKVDARILGFSVTSAEDRFNVGDRDYADV